MADQGEGKVQNMDAKCFHSLDHHKSASLIFQKDSNGYLPFHHNHPSTRRHKTYRHKNPTPVPRWAALILHKQAIVILNRRRPALPHQSGSSIYSPSKSDIPNLDPSRLLSRAKASRDGIGVDEPSSDFFDHLFFLVMVRESEDEVDLGAGHGLN